MKFNIFRQFLIAIGIVFFLCGCSHTSYLDSTDEVADEANSNEIEETKEQTKGIFVQVAGAVRSPGVYELSGEARVYEAIEAAGGLTQKAYDADLNQAGLLEDGQKIYVPTEKEAKKADESGTASDTGSRDGASPAGNLININTAGADELKSLSGIGDAKANAIISFREQNGGFKTPQDLMQVDGIGEGTYNKLKDQITV